MAGGRRCFVSLDILPQDGVVTYVSCESYLRGLKTVQQFRDLCIAAGDETREISAVELLAGITFMLEPTTASAPFTSLFGWRRGSV